MTNPRLFDVLGCYIILLVLNQSLAWLRVPRGSNSYLLPLQLSQPQGGISLERKERKFPSKTGRIVDEHTSSSCVTIKRLAESKKWDECFAEFQKHGNPNHYLYSAIIHAANLCKKVPEIKMLFRKMTGDLGKMSVNSFTYDNIMNCNLGVDDEEVIFVMNQCIQTEDKRFSKDPERKTVSRSNLISTEKCVQHSLQACLNLVVIHRQNATKGQEIWQQVVRICVYYIKVISLFYLFLFEFTY